MRNRSSPGSPRWISVRPKRCVVCVFPPDSAGKRLQEVSTHSTMTGSLIELANRLVEFGVQRVVMEATSDYWKPVFYLLEAHGLDPWLVNARDVKHLPGRPKSDVIDAVWLCKLAVGWSHRKQRRPQWSQAAGSAASVLLETHRRELEVDPRCTTVLINQVFRFVRLALGRWWQ